VAHVRGAAWKPSVILDLTLVPSNILTADVFKMMHSRRAAARELHDMDGRIITLGSSLREYVKRLIVIPCIMGILNHILVKRQANK
jgi:hypothetical protein